MNPISSSAYHGEVLSAGGVLQVISGLVLVVLVILGVAWFARRFGRFQGAASGELRLLGGIHVGQRERIVIVQAGEERLIVGVSPGCIRTLHVMQDPVGSMGLDPSDRDGMEKSRRSAESRGSAMDRQSFLERLREFRKRMQP
jgi:flagellar protein FliO/FliZ